MTFIVHLKAIGGAVPIQPSRDIRLGLLATLLKLEQSIDSVQYANSLAELKRIILLRIAELDAAEALEQAAVETTNTTNDIAPEEELPNTPAPVVDTTN